MIPPATHSAFLGIQHSLSVLDAAAERVAHRPITSATVADLMKMKTAQHGVAVNAATLRVAHDMSGQLIDVLA